MTDLTFTSFEGGAHQGAPPPVRPPWLRAASLAGVVAAHAGVAYLLLKLAVPAIASLEAISMELVPHGEFIETQEVTAAEEEPPPPEEIEQPDLAIPLPQVMSPDAPVLPQQKEVVEQKKKKIVERKREVERADKKREAQARHNVGAPEGQSGASGMSQSAYKALLAAAIRRHTPGTSALGAGTATCSFHVGAGGGISGVSASGSSAAHAALARQIVSSVHAPPPPGGAFSASQHFNFH